MGKHPRIGKVLTATLFSACSACIGQAAASTIVAPITAFASSDFASIRNNYAIENTINQSGLSLKYVSGVTDIASYLAILPTHSSNANGNEWFSQDFSKARKGRTTRNGRSATIVRKNSKVSKNRSVRGSTNNSATAQPPLVAITYGFDAMISINGFVLWNDEFAGIGATQLWSSIDGVKYTLLTTITPQPSTFAPADKVVPYLAQVFSFDPTLMLFFKLLIFDCPKPSANTDSYRGCGIGEVAFSALPQGSNQSPVVPVPAALPLLASALGIFAWLGRRQRNRI